MKTKNSPVGAALILAGTAIGGGMLALPATAAGIGFPTLCLLMIITWLVSYHAALLTMQVNLKVAPGASLYTMASITLGRPGKLLATVSPLILFYALLAAYITGGASLLQIHIPRILSTEPALSPTTYSLSFTVSGGILMYCGTRLVDHSNRIIFTLMMIAFLIVIYSLLPAVEPFNLNTMPIPQGAVLAILPILFTSFGFHGSVPSIILYLGSNRTTLTGVLLTGSLIPLLIYLVWIGITIGVLSNEALTAIATTGGDVGTLITTLERSGTSGSMLVTGLEFFSGCALLTSFFGVALGLFDYIRNSLPPRLNNRVITLFLTFTPPLLFATFYPDGFLYALGYAAAALAVLAIILPAMMSLKLYMEKREADFTIPGGLITLGSTFVYGLVIIFIQLK